MSTEPDGSGVVEAVTTVTADDLRQVEALEASAIVADHLSPLDDQSRLDIGRADAPHVLHLLTRDAAGTVVGYAHVRATEYGPRSTHVVVHPDHRRRGFGTALVERAAHEAGGAGIRVWAHGDVASAQLLSGRLGFRRVRDLWQMRRPLDLPIPSPAYPIDVSVRTFVVGQDESAWVDVNRAAFAHHPEQGAMAAADLRQRMEQPWFDPAGFFLAWRGEALLGFHWTKVHEADDSAADAVGEVYAVGVAPQAQGLGLGKALTATGLLHLRDLGLPEVLLYVEGDNAAAIAVYRKLGFTRTGIDVVYERD